MEISYDKWGHILLWYINIKFGTVIYGVGKNNLDTYALPVGLALHVKNDLPFLGGYIHIAYIQCTCIHTYYTVSRL